MHKASEEQELREVIADVRKRFRDSYCIGSKQKQAPNAAIDKLVRAVKTGAKTLESICNTLVLCPKDARALIDEARQHGYAIELDNGWIGKPEGQVKEGIALKMPAPYRGESVFAVASDLHIGSKHHMRAQLIDFAKLAYNEGARYILCPGDLLDGVYKFSIWEQRDRGFDEQCLRAVESLPRIEGLRWVFILGNHDETLGAVSGLDVGESIVNIFGKYGRDDIEFVGSRGAYVRLVSSDNSRGIVVELWHPKGSPAYSISYKPQKHVEQYSIGAKPDVMLVGHFHQAGYFVFRGVHCLQAGTFQGGKSAFGRSIGGNPAIGGWICRYSLTQDGTMRRFRPEFVAYYEHEAPRTLEMG